MQQYAVTQPLRGGVYLSALASPRLTVAFFLLMAGGSLAVAELHWPATGAVVLPLALLGVNLGAAIAIHPRFRVDLPLLLFHLALLALVMLLVLARLVYFEARTTLTAGSAFEGEVFDEQRGPWHDKNLASLHFINDGLAEDFSRYGKYTATANRVRWRDAAGRPQQSEIGDDIPLLIDGYRIYATRNRGFAPVFSWQTNGGRIEYGSVQLRDMGQGGFTPDSGWLLPDGPEIWAMLEPLQPIRREGRRTDLGADSVPHQLVIRVGETRHTLQPGESISVATGRLTYLELKSWMGYRISYDPTIPWLIAAVLTAIGSLLWFYAALFRGRGQRQLTSPVAMIDPLKEEAL